MAPPTTTTTPCPTSGRWKPGCQDFSGNSSVTNAFKSIGKSVGNFVSDSVRDTGRAIAATDRFFNKVDDDLGNIDEIVEGATCLAMKAVPPAGVICGAVPLLEQAAEEIEDRLG